jgi:hypothetical protein
MHIKALLPLSIVSLAMAATAGADPAVTVTLPDTSRTTTALAIIVEQVQVTIPATITFNVIDISVATPSATASPVTVTGIVLSTLTKQLKISVKAGGATFTGSATPYNASDVRWTGGTWINATPQPSGGTGLTTSYKEVATCSATLLVTCSTTDAVFSLAPNASIALSGTQSLTMTWKLESIGL